MKRLITGGYFLSILLLLSCGSDKSKKINNPVPVKKEVDNVQVIKESPEVTDGASPEQLAQAGEIIKAATDEKKSSFNARKSFKNYCAICHGFKGNMKMNGAKDLTLSNISLEESVAQVYFGKGLMTPFKGIMKDAEIVAVAEYIETLRKK